ncbi:MAG: hypothetical protein PHU63_04775, partial [Candidatus ainarchaeum sp.]|nr:hypothetical protein [Candidatus ainarchaeum sp.]
MEKNIFKKVSLYLENLFYGISFCFAKRVIFAAKDLQERAQKVYFPMKRKITHADLIIDEKLFV